MEIALCSFVNIPSFFTIFTKYSLNSFAIWISSSIVSSFSTNLIVVLDLILFEKRGLTICQNFVLSVIEFISKFARCYFLALFKRFTQKFRCFLYSFRDISVLSLKNLFLSLERFIIALCKFFVINLPWFALRYFCFIAACLFKTSMKILRKCWYYGISDIPCNLLLLVSA